MRVRDVEDLESPGFGDRLAVACEIDSERDLGCFQISGLGDIAAFTEMEDCSGGAGVGGWSGAQFGIVVFRGSWDPQMEQEVSSMEGA